MNSPQAAAVISEELKTYLECGPSVVVGTRDLGLVPEIARAWGVRVAEDRRSVDLCIPIATVGKTLDNLASNGQMAVSFAMPTNMKSVQMKGTGMEAGEPDAEDMAAVERHRDAFATMNERMGMPRKVIERFWHREVETGTAMVKLRFVPEQIFNQTPGPGAGSRL
jgi:hypothetical protein